jgi:hypothetical protein
MRIRNQLLVVRDTVTFHWPGDGGQRAWMKNALFESQVLFTA